MSQPILQLQEADGRMKFELHRLYGVSVAVWRVRGRLGRGRRRCSGHDDAGKSTTAWPVSWHQHHRCRSKWTFAPSMMPN
eukprot:39620-Eustigmatos_ZCMA.PRE.1